MKTENWITYDPQNHEIEYFESEGEAVKFLTGMLSDDSDEFVPEEVESGDYFVAKITHQSTFKVVANKKNFTDEEWEEEGYSSDFDRVGNVELVKLPEPQPCSVPTAPDAGHTITETTWIPYAKAVAARGVKIGDVVREPDPLICRVLELRDDGNLLVEASNGDTKYTFVTTVKQLSFEVQATYNFQ